MRAFIAAVATALAASPASAHPDHRAGEAVGLLHYLADPFHVATGLVAVGAVILGLAVWRSRRSVARRSVTVERHG